MFGKLYTTCVLFIVLGHVDSPPRGRPSGPLITTRHYVQLSEWAKAPDLQVTRGFWPAISEREDASDDIVPRRRHSSASCKFWDSLPVYHVQL